MTVSPLFSWQIAKQGMRGEKLRLRSVSLNKAVFWTVERHKISAWDLPTIVATPPSLVCLGAFSVASFSRQVILEQWHPHIKFFCVYITIRLIHITTVSRPSLSVRLVCILYNSLWSKSVYWHCIHNKHRMLRGDTRALYVCNSNLLPQCGRRVSRRCGLRCSARATQSNIRQFSPSSVGKSFSIEGAAVSMERKDIKPLLVLEMLRRTVHPLHSPCSRVERLWFSTLYE